MIPLIVLLIGVIFCLVIEIISLVAANQKLATKNTSLSDENELLKDHLLYKYTQIGEEFKIEVLKENPYAFVASIKHFRTLPHNHTDN